MVDKQQTITIFYQRKDKMSKRFWNFFLKHISAFWEVASIRDAHQKEKNDGNF